LRLDSCSFRERGIADDVSERLSFRLVLLEDFALGVVADDFIVDEAAEIELLAPERPEFGHDGGGWGGYSRCEWRWSLIVKSIARADGAESESESEHESERRQATGSRLAPWKPQFPVLCS
jgi:hypothetical protein